MRQYINVEQVEAKKMTRGDYKITVVGLFRQTKIQQMKVI